MKISYLQPQEGFKACSTCQEEKEIIYFSRHKDKCQTKGWRYCANCKPCEKIRKRESRLRIQYGLKEEDYTVLSSHKENRCWICGLYPKEGKVLNIDHNHKTGEIRGLLCLYCNLILGCINDDVVFLKGIIGRIETYLGDNGLKVKELLSEPQRSFSSRVA